MKKKSYIINLYLTDGKWNTLPMSGKGIVSFVFEKQKEGFL